MESKNKDFTNKPRQMIKGNYFYIFSKKSTMDVESYLTYLLSFSKTMKKVNMTWSSFGDGSSRKCQLGNCPLKKLWEILRAFLVATGIANVFCKFCVRANFLFFCSYSFNFVVGFLILFLIKTRYRWLQQDWNQQPLHL